MPVTKAQASENLEQLIAKFYRLTSEQKGDLSESSVFGGFVLPLFRDVLGWPTEDVTKFEREKAVAGGRRVDGVLSLDSGERVFVEAKKFGAIERLSNSNEWTMGPGQLSLPSMATDRTREEQQAINYAFENGGKWAILSNFERLRLFNARRDWLVFAFEAPAAYKEEFEQLWQLSWEEMHRGSLDLLSDQRVVKDVDTSYLDFINQQREQLATDITLNSSANAWAFSQSGELRLDAVRAVVQRFLDRLVVVRFAEDHFVIDPGSLKRAYDYGRDNPYARDPYHYLREFFQYFDANHNSALFSAGEVDEATFSETVLDPLVETLYQARFRAMPADIIGNTYEEYLAKTLVLEDGAIAIQDNLETRKAQGSYYTPQYIVEFIVDHTLGRYLYGTHNGKPNGVRIYGQERKTSADIRDLRVLDSACGSGSFLIYAYQVFADFYQSEIERMEREYREQTADVASFLDIPIQVRQIQAEGVFIRDNYRRMILEEHLYGVDLDPQAAEIAVMNLILRALEGSKQSQKLPLILNQNIKVGNSLIGLRPDDERVYEHAEALARIRRLRAELLQTPNVEPRHDEILEALEIEKQALYSRYEPDYAARDIDADRSRPFHWAIEFPEVYVDEEGKPLKNGGFDFIVGNPPYGAKLDNAKKAYFKREFNIRTTNTAPLFMMQSLNLLNDGGVHGYIVPKSFLYASNWRIPRDRLLDGLEALADCEKAFSGVLLEQVIYLHSRSEKSANYLNYARNGDKFALFGSVDKRECETFGLYMNTIAPEELAVAHVMLASNHVLGDFVSVNAGADLQNQLNTFNRGTPTVGGAQVQRYHLRGIRGYVDSESVHHRALVGEGHILVQDILAFIELPMRHVKITAHQVQQDQTGIYILNTLNQIEVTSRHLPARFVLAMLNSRLINWYVYRFLFSKPVRTMHFNRPIISRIPLPDWQNHSELVADVVTEVEKIYQNRHANEKSSQQRIDQYIYRLYGLSPEQIELVESNMP